MMIWYVWLYWLILICTMLLDERIYVLCMKKYSIKNPLPEKNDIRAPAKFILSTLPKGQVSLLSIIIIPLKKIM